MADQTPFNPETPRSDDDVAVLEEVDDGLSSPDSLGWRCILYNDDVHSFDQVVNQVIAAVGCNLQKATDITYTAHTKGRAIVYEGKKKECEAVALVLKQIDLRVEIARD